MSVLNSEDGCPKVRDSRSSQKVQQANWTPFKDVSSAWSPGGPPPPHRRAAAGQGTRTARWRVDGDTLGTAIVRLADGALWHLADGEGTSWGWRAPLAITCDEIFVRVFDRPDPSRPGRFTFLVVLAGLESTPVRIAPAADRVGAAPGPCVRSIFSRVTFTVTELVGAPSFQFEVMTWGAHSNGVDRSVADRACGAARPSNRRRGGGI